MSWPGLCCENVGASPIKGSVVVSVSAETAIYSQQAFGRARDTTDPSTGFSSLVDGNTDAASANRDESARQQSNQAAPPRADDSNSADAANTNDKTPPARGETKTASNSDGSAKTTNPAGQQQQPADASATTDPSVTADATKAVAQVKSADIAAQGVPSQGDGKGKATTKSEAKGDGATADSAQSAPVDQATTLVVAVVAEITSPNTVALTADSSSNVTATTAPSSVPGAIAAAAASKVAADVAATGLTATIRLMPRVIQGSPADAKAAATDQAQAIITAQPSAPQSIDPTSAQLSTAPVVAGDAAALAQAAAAAQTTGSGPPRAQPSRTARSARTRKAPPPRSNNP